MCARRSLAPEATPPSAWSKRHHRTANRSAYIVHRFPQCLQLIRYRFTFSQSFWRLHLFGSRAIDLSSIRFAQCSSLALHAERCSMPLSTSAACVGSVQRLVPPKPAVLWPKQESCGQQPTLRLCGSRRDRRSGCSHQIH